jgi:hypothetical protein
MGLLRVYSKVPILFVLDDNVAYQMLFLTGARSEACQLLFGIRARENIRVSQCLTNIGVYVILDEMMRLVSFRVQNYIKFHLGWLIH